MRKIITLLLVTSAWFVGFLSSRVSGAGVPGPEKPVPIVLDLNKFGEEMLIADRWFSLMNNDENKDAYVSLATDPKFGKCLKIDYSKQNYFGYLRFEPVDISEYDKITFKLKGDGTQTAFVFELLDANGVSWGYGPFYVNTTEWATNEVMLRFPTWPDKKTLDLTKIVRIDFYENGNLAKLSSVYVTDFKLITEESVSAVRKVSSVNSNGNLMADGKPFFPLVAFGTMGTNEGKISVSAVPGWLKALKDAGFNMVLSYTVRNREDYQPWLDSAQAAGLKVMACTYPFMVQSSLPVEPVAREAEIAKRKEVLKAHIETVRDHPAMAAYYTTDEIYGLGISKEQLGLFYDYIRSLDTIHPTLAVECTDAGFPTYKKATDMFAPDIYPIRKAYPADITMIATRLDLIKTVQKGTPPKPDLWIMLQMFRISDDNPNVTQETLTRFPTEGEMRAMTFLALTMDVKGIVYGFYNVPDHTPPYSQSQPEHWQHVSNAINSVHTVFPALLSDKVITGYTASSDKIYSIAREVQEGDKKYLYLLVVNPSDGKKQETPLTVTFKGLPAGDTTIQVLDEDSAGKFKLGSVRKLDGYLAGFTDNFEENAVHVYKMELK